MTRFQSYFNTAINLIQGYNGTQPLVHYLKAYFTQEKKHGSKDRKYIAHLCYCYFRLGFAIRELSVKERLRIALFIMESEPGYWSYLYRADWVKNWQDDRAGRVAFIEQQYPIFSIQHVYPWKDELSAGVDHTALSFAAFIQPDLFIRIRPGMEKQVLDKLTNAGISYNNQGNDCVALLNGTKLDNLLELDAEAVVQDKSSQRVRTYFPEWKGDRPIDIWDSCSASGGKSILAADMYGDVNLTVSDTRPGIMQNLKERLERAGITRYRSFLADLSRSSFVPNDQYDLVICDTPCTGSGTWSRTPEQLAFFGTDKITLYTALQEKIATNVVKAVRPGGHLLYITCSLFCRENEDMVQKILASDKQLELKQQGIITGYMEKADTMFAALIQRKAS